MRYIIGDPHGTCDMAMLCHLLRDSEIYCVGDLFDRGEYSASVWHLVHLHKIRCVMGNHERKMLQFLQGQREHLPPHYYYAMDRLRATGVKRAELTLFIEELPLTIRLTAGDREIIIAHAGIDPRNPRADSVSYNVYGNDGCNLPQVPWWDQYTGQDIYASNSDPLIIYGHLSQEPPFSAVPRIRYCARYPLVPISIGIDTGAVSGGPLTAYGIDDKAFVTYRSGVNYVEKLQERLRPLGKVWARDMRDSLLRDW